MGKEYSYFPPKILSKEDDVKYFVNLSNIAFDLKNGLTKKKKVVEETPNKEALKVLERVSRLIKKKMDETKSEDFNNIIIQFEEWKIMFQD
jgi:hypothetical protein